MRRNPSLILSAGKGCFTNCKGCYQYFGKNDIPTYDLIEFVKKYKENFDLTKVTLAGGDPMTRSDIILLVDSLYKLDLELYMDTVGKNFIGNSKINFNGSGMVDYVNPLALKNKISVIGIPVDGFSTEQINYFRKNLTLEEIKKILYVLDENNFNICINTVANKGNINDLEKIRNLLMEFKNINKWQIFQYSPIGDLGYKNRELFEISEQLFTEKIKELLNLPEEHNITIEGKTNSYRKLNYLLINSDGKVWQPKYSLHHDFQNVDVNDEKIIIGTIYDKDIMDKIKKHLTKVNDNVSCSQKQLRKTKTSNIYPFH